MVDMQDVQNYYLSFFGSVQNPKAQTVEEIIEEVEDDTDQ